MTVAYDADFNRHQQTTAEAAGQEQGGVTIKITGALAQQMIGRGEAQEQLIRDLVRRLESLEASKAETAAEQERLSQRTQELHRDVSALSGQFAQVQAELGRVAADFVDSYKFRHLHAKVEALEGAIRSLHGAVQDLARPASAMPETA